MSATDFSSLKRSRIGAAATRRAPLGKDKYPNLALNSLEMLQADADHGFIESDSLFGEGVSALARRGNAHMPDDLNRRYSPRRVVEILLVEDDDADAVIFEKISQMVGSLDLRVTRVKDVLNAQIALRKARVDVCMLDYWLEKGSSARLMCTLGDRRDVGVVLLSHATSTEIQRMGPLTSGTPFLSKGDCSPETLEAAVHAAMPSRVMTLRGSSREALRAAG